MVEDLTGLMARRARRWLTRDGHREAKRREIAGQPRYGEEQLTLRGLGKSSWTYNVSLAHDGSVVVF